MSSNNLELSDVVSERPATMLKASGRNIYFHEATLLLLILFHLPVTDDMITERVTFCCFHDNNR